MNKFKQLKVFQGVAASTTASLSTAEMYGKAIHAIHFVIGGGNTKANMTRIQIRYNSIDVINQITGTQLAAMNTWKALPTSTTDVPFYFGNPEAPDFHGKHDGDLDTTMHPGPNGSIPNLEIQVDLGAGASPTLTAWVEYTDPKQTYGFSAADARLVKCYKRSLLTPSAALARQPQDIAVGAGVGAGIWNEFYFHANVTSLEVDKDNVILWADVPIAQMNAWQLEQAHTAVSGMYVFSPSYEHNTRSVLSTLKEDGSKVAAIFQHLLTTSAADTINVFAEVVGDFYNATQ